MASLYEDLRLEVDALLADLGRPITFNRYTYVNDLVQGTSVPTLAFTQTLKAALLPASGGTLEAFDVRFMTGVEDDTNVRFAIVSAEGFVFVPGPKDKAVFDGVVWNVMGCTPLNVNGTAVIFSVGFRLPS
jgi:tetrahydromethanopterin S-methyltransferase subunit D